MNANARNRQKASRSNSETADSETVHFVCHDCTLETLTDYKAGALAYKRLHEQDTGHSVSVEVVDA